MSLVEDVKALPVLLLLILCSAAFATFATVWLIGLYERGKAAATLEFQQRLRLEDQLAGRTPLKLDQYDATPELARFRLRFATRLGLTVAFGWPVFLWGTLPSFWNFVFLAAAVLAWGALAPRVPPIPPSSE